MAEKIKTLAKTKKPKHRQLVPNSRVPLKVKVVIHDAEEGGFWAEVPALSGCFTQGETREELLANLREAIEGILLGPTDTEPLGKEARIKEICI